jgi:hypothetical protein
LITGSSYPTAIAVDGSHIYWANVGTNAIGTANLDGSGVNESLITGAAGATGVAVDSSHLYWTGATGNTIGRANLDGSGATQS